MAVSMPTADLVVNEETLRRLEDLVANVYATRQDFFNQFFDPRKNLEQECGYPPLRSIIPAEAYHEAYDRNPIAARVNDILPDECWKVHPDIFQDDDESKTTPFEEAWAKVGQGLRGQSWFRDPKGSPIWEYLWRLDRLAGIGRFGIMLLGFDDGMPLWQPVNGVSTGDVVEPVGTEAEYFRSPMGVGPVPAPGVGGPVGPNGPGGTTPQALGVPRSSTPELPRQSGEGRSLRYLRVFPETLVQVVQYESSIFNPRFGQPVMYQVQLNDPRTPQTGVGMPLASIRVHWTRAIHFADNLMSSEVFGVPRMQQVWERLLDLRKVYGADAEAFWKNCLIKLLLESNPQLGGDVRYDRAKVQQSVNDFMTSLQPYLALTGFVGKTIAPTVVDPTPHVNVAIQAICIKGGYPQRIFMGSERGELASNQDDATHTERIRHRQINVLTPRACVPLVDRLIYAGVLPDPGEEGWRCSWPDMTTEAETDKATVALSKTQALAAYTTSGADTVVGPQSYLTGFLGFPQEVAEAMLDEGAEHAAEQQEQAAEAVQQQQEAMQQGASNGTEQGSGGQGGSGHQQGAQGNGNGQAAGNGPAPGPQPNGPPAAGAGNGAGK